MIASILKSAGLKAGLYTSPHLTDFCERIKIGDILISPESVVRLVNRVHEFEEEKERLTFFELATAIAFLYFAEQKVDLAVLEVGLGGRLDATNVVTPLVSVITTIGLDHTAHLGGTLSKIAFEKGGIIKAGVSVVTGPMSEEAFRVIREIAEERGAPLLPFNGQKVQVPARLGLEGEHQRDNAALAVTVIDFLKKDPGFSVTDLAVRKGLESVVWPGRLETVFQRPWVILDGAHNPQAMGAVRKFLEQNLKGRKLVVVFGAMADKDVEGIFSEIVPIADEFIFTAPKLKRALAPERLVEIVAPFQKPVRVRQEVEEAVEEALKKGDPQNAILITGSLFVVGEARRYIVRNRRSVRTACPVPPLGQ